MKSFLSWAGGGSWKAEVSIVVVFFFLITWAFHSWQNWACSEYFPARSSSPGDYFLSTQALALPRSTWTPNSSGPAGCSLMSSSLWCSISAWRGLWRGVCVSPASDGAHHIPLKQLRALNPFYHSPAAAKLPMGQQVERNVSIKKTGPSSRALQAIVPSSPTTQWYPRYPTEALNSIQRSTNHPSAASAITKGWTLLSSSLVRPTSYMPHLSPGGY